MCARSCQAWTCQLEVPQGSANRSASGEAATGRGVPSRHVRLRHWRWREWELGRVTDFVLRNTVWEWPSMKSDPRACRAGKYREVAQSPVPNIWRDHRSRRRNLENVSAKAPTLIYLLFAFLVLVTAGDSCCGSR